MKTPKTESRVRKVFLPRSVAEELIAWKAQQEEIKDILQEEYQDYGLILATEYGLPRGGAYIRDSLNKLIKQHDLPQIVFHSFRHMSVTYKLKLNGGDIKAVQGDSGHAQADMVTEVYSHIIDEDRRRRHAQHLRVPGAGDGVHQSTRGGDGVFIDHLPGQQIVKMIRGEQQPLEFGNVDPAGA